MTDPHTHSIPETIRREDAGPLTLELVREIRDCLSNEQAWAIAKRYLDLARLEGPPCADCSCSSEPCL